MRFSPFSVLYANIAAQMAALSMTHADETAFKTWAYAAWIDSGFTGNFAVLKQPSAQLSIQFDVRVGTSGHKVDVWWGDGTSNSYSPTTSVNTACAKTYATGAIRPVVLIGKATRFESINPDGKTAFGGSVAGLTGLTILYVSGSNTLSGSVAGLTQLTYLNVQGMNTLTGWELVAASATGLRYFYQRGLTVLTSSQVNAVLAGFWANRDAAKPRGDRTIDVANTGNGAPTDQGIADKAALQAYKSPNNTGPVVWTVTTN